MSLKSKIKEQMVKNLQKEFDAEGKQFNHPRISINWQVVKEYYRYEGHGMFEATVKAARQVVSK